MPNLYNNTHQKNLLAKLSRVGQVRREVAQGFVQWYYTSKRAQVLLIAYLVIFVLFLVLAWFVHIHPVLPVDVAITQEFQEQRLPWLKSFIIGISFLGSHFFLFAFLIFLTAALFWLIQLRLEAIFIMGLSVLTFRLIGR